MWGGIENVGELLDASMEWLTNQVRDGSLGESSSAVLFKSMGRARRLGRKAAAGKGYSRELDRVVGKSIRDCGSAA